MKIKKVLSAILAATMLLGSVTANAVTIESDDTPKASGAAVEQESLGDGEVTTVSNIPHLHKGTIANTPVKPHNQAVF